MQCNVEIDEFISDVLLCTSTLEHISIDWPTKTQISPVRTSNAVKRTYQVWWTIRMNGEKEREREREREGGGDGQGTPGCQNDLIIIIIIIKPLQMNQT